MGEDRSKGQEAADLTPDEQGASPVLGSDGLDAARVYVGPTVVPVSPVVRVNDPKVKVTDPRRVAATMKITRPPGGFAEPAPARGTIDAPMARPADAFQPLAVDPALVQEWIARKGQPGAAPDPGLGDAAANDAEPDPSRWAQTEKVERIDRSALPSSHAPKAVDEAASGERVEADDGAVRKSSGGATGRGVWVPLIATVFGGVVVGPLVIKFVLLPEMESNRPGSAAPVETAAPSVVQPVAPATVTAAPVPTVAEPLAEEPIPSATEESSSAPAGELVGAAPSGVISPPVTAPPMVPRPWPAPTPKPSPTATARPSPTPSSPPAGTQAPKVLF